MHARISTFEGISMTPELAKEIEDKVTPMLEGMTGWQGGMQLLDLGGAKAMTISLFDTEENMQAAEPTFEEMPQKLGGLRERLGGERTTVGHYEVVSKSWKG